MPVAYLTRRDVADRLLRVPRLAAAAASARLEPRQRRAVRPLRARRARGERLRRPSQPGTERGAAALGGHRRRGAQVGSRASRRLRRRLRDRARLVATGELGRRRLLDGGHGRDPADAPAASGSPPAAARLRGDRAAGAPRPAALRTDASPVCVGARLLCVRGRVQPARGGRASELARRVRLHAASRLRPVRRRCRSLRARRQRASRRSTSSPSAPTRIATSRCSCASRSVCPTSASGSSRAASIVAALGRCPRTSTSRPRSRSTRCGGGSPRLASSRCRCGRTATPARRRCCSRRWRSAKPVVVTRTKAIETGYGLVDGENCRLVAPGDEAGFERALTGVLRDEFHARALGSSARATVERELTWDRYVSRIEELLRDAAAAPAPSRPGAA